MRKLVSRQRHFLLPCLGLTAPTVGRPSQHTPRPEIPAKRMERRIKKGDSGDELKVCYYGVISQSAYLLSATTPCTRSGFRVCWSSSTAPIVVALFRHFNFHNTSKLLFVFLDLLMTYWFLSASTRERLSLAESSFGLFALRADGLESSSVTDNPDSNRVDQHKYYANFWTSCRHT